MKTAELRILRRHRGQLSTERKRVIIFITTILDEYLWKENRPSKGIRLSKKLATQFIDIAKDSIGITTGSGAARMRLNDLLDQLNILDQQIENCDQAMDDIISSLNIEKYLTSVPGVGKITAASFIAETGKQDCFDDWK